MKMVFVGDLFVGGDILSTKPKNFILPCCFKNADFRVCNLEQAISNCCKVADKGTIYSGSEALPFLKKFNLQGVSLANNHIHDKGTQGILDTINHLNSINIKTFGAGKNRTESRKPLWVSKEVCLLSYCEKSEDYLRKIQIAEKDKPGISLLDFKLIEEDLAKLPKNTKAILFFHWGREHVWLPPFKNIDLAKRLLKNPKVYLIIGNHPHRIQGCVSYKNKKAYMSLGNFLYPNFFIKPSLNIYYPIKAPTNFEVTKNYHKVSKITYKRWNYLNRVSLIVNTDMAFKYNSSVFVVQNEKSHGITELKKLEKLMWFSLFLLLNKLYCLPKPLYVALEKISTFISVFRRKVNLASFYLKSGGMKGLYGRMKGRREL